MGGLSYDLRLNRQCLHLLLIRVVMGEWIELCRLLMELDRVDVEIMFPAFG